MLRIFDLWLQRQACDDGTHARTLRREVRHPNEPRHHLPYISRAGRGDGPGAGRPQWPPGNLAAPHLGPSRCSARVAPARRIPHRWRGTVDTPGPRNRVALDPDRRRTSPGPLERAGGERARSGPGRRAVCLRRDPVTPNSLRPIKAVPSRTPSPGRCIPRRRADRTGCHAPRRWSRLAPSTGVPGTARSPGRRR